MTVWIAPSRSDDVAKEDPFSETDAITLASNPVIHPALESEDAEPGSTQGAKQQSKEELERNLSHPEASPAQEDQAQLQTSEAAKSPKVEAESKAEPGGLSTAQQVAAKATEPPPEAEATLSPMLPDFEPGSPGSPDPDPEGSEDPFGDLGQKTDLGRGSPMADGQQGGAPPDGEEDTGTMAAAAAAEAEDDQERVSERGPDSSPVGNVSPVEEAGVALPSGGYGAGDDAPSEAEAEAEASKLGGGRKATEVAEKEEDRSVRTEVMAAAAADDVAEDGRGGDPLAAADGDAAPGPAAAVVASENAEDAVAAAGAGGDAEDLMYAGGDADGHGDGKAGSAGGGGEAEAGALSTSMDELGEYKPLYGEGTTEVEEPVAVVGATAADVDAAAVGSKGTDAKAGDGESDGVAAEAAEVAAEAAAELGREQESVAPELQQPDGGGDEPLGVAAAGEEEEDKEVKMAAAAAAAKDAGDLAAAVASAVQDHPLDQQEAERQLRAEDSMDADVGGGEGQMYGNPEREVSAAAAAAAAAAEVPASEPALAEVKPAVEAAEARSGRGTASEPEREGSLRNSRSGSQNSRGSGGGRSSRRPQPATVEKIASAASSTAPPADPGTASADVDADVYDDDGGDGDVYTDPEQAHEDDEKSSSRVSSDAVRQSLPPQPSQRQTNSQPQQQQQQDHLPELSSAGPSGPLSYDEQQQRKKQAATGSGSGDAARSPGSVPSSPPGLPPVVPPLFPPIHASASSPKSSPSSTQDQQQKQQQQIKQKEQKQRKEQQQQQQQHPPSPRSTRDVPGKAAAAAAAAAIPAGTGGATSGGAKAKGKTEAGAHHAAAAAAATATDPESITQQYLALLHAGELNRRPKTAPEAAAPGSSTTPRSAAGSGAAAAMALTSPNSSSSSNNNTTFSQPHSPHNPNNKSPSPPRPGTGHSAASGNSSTLTAQGMELARLQAKAAWEVSPIRRARHTNSDNQSDSGGGGKLLPPLGNGGGGADPTSYRSPSGGGGGGPTSPSRTGAKTGPKSGDGPSSAQRTFIPRPTISAAPYPKIFSPGPGSYSPSVSRQGDSSHLGGQSFGGGSPPRAWAFGAARQRPPHVCIHHPNASPGPVYLPSKDGLSTWPAQANPKFERNLPGGRFILTAGQPGNAPMFNPGPGSYQPETNAAGDPLSPGRSGAMPAYSFAHTRKLLTPATDGAALPVLSKEHVREYFGTLSPGPAQYSPDTSPTRTAAPAYSVAGRRKCWFDPVELSPGPIYKPNELDRKGGHSLGDSPYATIGKGPKFHDPTHALSSSAWLSFNHARRANYGIHSPGPVYLPNDPRAPRIPSPSLATGPLDRFSARNETGRLQ
ncbi:hypothetical protein VOLCADRAFT_96651 [Volvox carteri f. nagariensis]|uniref:Uncharacterized protein n=1 Tax=Volvox carteri f. nagariensis TaxID=3068 RepID=D8UAP3_VOLCA|nr:uncharacterized protein VOLCADRAFT_96651 [Volvox carteri f. nagariensis]EFJ43189.1 hypothetical protein VOLCADRAFT_96651 [Volvox carteri f. nagariensis]|eukprot:XP_002955764.1 hypothetical protein VOLCADRAFT_96651 [Volvox carteri f. nagariensis]